MRLSMIRSDKKRSRAQASVELALTMPFFLMLLCAVVEWGFIIYREMDLEGAVREGSRYAAKNKVTRDQILDRVKQTAMFNVDRIWILPGLTDSSTGAVKAVTVMAQNDYYHVTPLDGLLSMVTKSTPAFQFDFLSASSTFKFQESHDPSIFDDWNDYNGSTEEQGGSMSGMININPGNNNQFEFIMVLMDGTEITRDDMHANRSLEFTGKVKSIHIKPKGNANQNSLIVDGQPYVLQNARVYDITGDGINVHLYNDNANGMGKWWLGDVSGTNVSIINYGPGHGGPGGGNGTQGGQAE
jgi:Flp pilus assembly protein TadG